jgi:hypothetical protein
MGKNPTRVHLTPEERGACGVAGERTGEGTSGAGEGKPNTAMNLTAMGAPAEEGAPAKPTTLDPTKQPPNPQ